VVLVLRLTFHVSPNDKTMNADPHIAVFARAPVPGEAKTRLIARLGAQGAARLQEQLIERALVRACAVAAAQVTLWVAGDVGHPFMRGAAQRHGVALAVQAGNDLGARMAHAFDAALARAAACVLIGTDCPAMTPAHIAQAAELLRTHDVVLQPALDGGYVLIGLRASQPGLFHDIAWGTAEVLAATRARIAALGLACAELPPLPDLDTAADYDHACAAGWITAIEE
jgi:hypothetical protein